MLEQPPLPMPRPAFSLALATALMAFPQIAETLYSPALAQIAQAYAVSPAQAAQTLSLYFIAFALGVVVWGRLCDTWGRRPVMLAGLLLYALASLGALFSTRFEGLLIARMLAAFGAAVGSVCTQTMLRDSYQGAGLAAVSSVMGMVLALSPALGMAAGAAAMAYAGWQAVLVVLALLALALLLWAAVALPETQGLRTQSLPLWPTALRMLGDGAIWRTAALVAVFNTSVFAYYQLGAFAFAQQQLSMAIFGASGVLLAGGAVLGAWLNTRLLRRHWTPQPLVLLAAAVLLTGALGTAALSGSRYFAAPMFLVMLAFGLAIPNLLAGALLHYRDCAGTAGAWLGLMYYLMLGLALVLAGWVQHLATILLVCAAAAFGLALWRPGTARH